MKTAIDLFCGSGAVSWGLKSAGFQVVGAVDIDETACKTYRANHPEVDLAEEDIAGVSPSRFTDKLENGLAVLAVCAPCQPFSNQNRHRTSDDERARLVLNALPFVASLQPELVFFENVPGISRQPIFQELAEGLAKQGYHVGEPIKVDAAELGVPQRRQRMILIAAKDVTVLSRAEAISTLERRTVYQVIGDMPTPPLGAKNADADPLHYARQHHPITIERMKHIPADGGSRESLPKRLQLSCHRGRDKNSFPDTYGRMKWTDVAPTLTTGCTDLTKGRFAHPEQHRSITLREAARLQSFPDEYIFIGNASQVATQIGNAVPPAMMAAIAGSIHAALSDTPQQK